MTDNVVRLAASQSQPVKRACQDCRFYKPDIASFGKSRAQISLWPPSMSFWKEPNSESRRYAVCTAFGGYYAKIERGAHGDCGAEGRMFDPAER